MPRKSLREAILDAAERVITRQGLANTSVDAIAAEAGVSKGGLFYHFASKKELLLRLIERYQEGFFAMRDRIAATLPDTPARILKATIVASVDLRSRRANHSGNLIPLLDDADLRERITGFKARVFDEVVRGSRSPERATLAMLATDGLWVSDLLGAPVLKGEARKRVVDELLKLIDALDIDT